MLGLIASLGIAAAAQLGAGASMVAVRKGSGWYGLRPAVSTWWEPAAFEGRALRPRTEISLAIPLRDSSDVWTHWRGWERGSLSLGWWQGSDPHWFVVECGVAMTVLHTHWTEPSSVNLVEILPGARMAVGWSAVLGESWILDGRAGGSSRGRSLDMDVRVGLGRTW